jgi:hypothetical protein
MAFHLFSKTKTLFYRISHSLQRCGAWRYIALNRNMVVGRLIKSSRHSFSGIRIVRSRFVQDFVTNLSGLFDEV